MQICITYSLEEQRIELVKRFRHNILHFFSIKQRGDEQR